MEERANRDGDAKVLEENSEINEAWDGKKFLRVLELLQNDSEFPQNFSVTVLAESDEVQKQLKSFVDQRMEFHKLLEEGNWDQIEKQTSHITELGYCFNVNNQSAAYTAFKNEHYQIYGRLLLIGAKLTENEKCEMKKLPDKEKNKIREILLSNFPTFEASHLYYLLSKIKTKPKDFFGTQEIKIIDVLETLNNFPEISVVLKVIQFASNLDVVVDFNSKNVSLVNPRCLIDSTGITLPEEATVYVATGEGRRENQIRGTVAHEITHLAFNSVFKNDCKPYKRNSKEQGEFENLLKEIKKKISNLEDDPAETLSAVFDYPKEKQEAELIVKVPQILVQHYNGKTWLSNNAEKLLKFYEEKVIPECEKYVSDAPFLKFRNYIESFNESKGEMYNIRNKGLFFKKVEKIEAYFHSFSNKHIFAWATAAGCTWSGLSKVLQAMCGDEYLKGNGRFLVFKFENFVYFIKYVKLAFSSQVANTLIIECPKDLTNEIFPEDVQDVLRIAQESENKKIIFIINANDKENLKKAVEDIQIFDDYKEFSLLDVDDFSKENILKKDIEFQGKNIALGELIKNNEELLKYVNKKFISELLENRILKIGSAPLGTSNLEGAYADILLEINLEVLKNEVNTNDSSSIFVFNGIKEEELINHFGSDSEESRRMIEAMIEKFEANSFNCKKLLISDIEVSDDQFEKFCSKNPEKKIYLIGKSEVNKLVLIHLYNPNFYHKRKFISKVTIKENIFEELEKISKEVQQKIDDIFLIQCDDDHVEFSKNVKYMKTENAEEEFEKLREDSKNVHLLKLENGELIWVKSTGSLSNLRRLIKEKNQGNDFNSEDELMETIENQRVVLLSGNPGTGKTTTVTELCKIKIGSESFVDKHWVINVKLQDHSSAISNLKNCEFEKIEEVLAFFVKVDQSLAKGICKDLFRFALMNDTFSRPLLIIFDGFDEILEEKEKKKFISLFKFFQQRFVKNSQDFKKTKAKILITTRFHCTELLEDLFSIFTVKFSPMDENEKKIYIKNFFKTRLKLILKKEDFESAFGNGDVVEENSKMGKYTTAFIGQMETIFIGELERFLGTPLHLYLPLENSIKAFINWIMNNDTLDPDLLYLGKDLLEIYENFINRKFDIFFEKLKVHQILQKRLKMDYEHYHEKLANSFILKKKVANQLKSLETEVLLLGIVKMERRDLDITPNLDFIHFTFREYFFAQSFMRNLITYLRGKNRRFSNMTNQIREILVEEKYQLIRSFINLKFKNMKETNKTEYENGFHDRFNLLWEGNRLTSEGIFHTAVEENNSFIFEFLISNVPSRLIFPLLQSTSAQYDETLFEIAAKIGNEFIRNIIFDLAQKITSNEDRKNLLDKHKYYIGSPLQLAAENGHLKIVENIISIVPDDYLLNILRSPLDRNEFSRDSALGLAIRQSNFEIVKFLLEITLQKLSGDEEKRKYFKLPKYQHDGQMILQVAAQTGDINIFKFILKKATEVFIGFRKEENPDQEEEDDEDQEEEDDEDQEEEENPDQEGKEDPDLTNANPELLKIMKDKDARNNYDVLEYAVLSTNCDLVKYILENFHFKNGEHRSFLKNIRDSIHLATIRNQVKIVSLMLDKSSAAGVLGDILCMQGDSGRNILHCSVQYSNSETTKIILEKIKETFTQENQIFDYLSATDNFGQTVLHLIAANNHFNFKDLKAIISDAEEMCFSGSSGDQLMLDNLSGRHNFYKFCDHISFSLNISQNSHVEVFSMITEILKALLEFQLSELIFKKNRGNQTVFHYSCITGRLEIINWIFENLGWGNGKLDLDGAEGQRDGWNLMNKTDKLHQTGLHWAVAVGRKDVFEFLFEKITDNLSERDIFKFLSEKCNVYGENILDLANNRRANVEPFSSMLQKFFPRNDYCVT